MARRKRQKRRSSQDKDQDAVCKMIKVSKKDEDQGNRYYLRMAEKLTKRSRKRVPSFIAHQERGHLSMLKNLERELMC